MYHAKEAGRLIKKKEPQREAKRQGKWILAPSNSHLQPLHGVTGIRQRPERAQSWPCEHAQTSTNLRKWRHNYLASHTATRAYIVVKKIRA
jgi:hypothetical protein